MNKKENWLDRYWEDKLGLKYKEEILLYRMLCDDKIPQKDIRKYNINSRYRTFGAWEKHIKGKILKISNDELREYQKYINLKRTKVSSISGMFNIFFIPFLIALISPFIEEGFKECIKIGSDNLIISIICLIVVYLFFLYVIYFLIKHLSKEEREQKRDQLFYNDIYEIVQTEIEERSK